MSVPTIDGFSEPKSYGEPVLCTGCWDASNHNIQKDNDIPAGQLIYYRQCSYEYDEYDAYCQKCAEQYASQTY